MKDLKRIQIINLFKDPQRTMLDGLWFSGIQGKGEIKRWHENGKLKEHWFWKDGELDGEGRTWYYDGKPKEYSYRKNGKLEGELKKWNKSGELKTHRLYKHGKIIKDYLE